MSVDAMSAPSALGPVGAAGSAMPAGGVHRSTSAAYSPLNLRLSVTCDLFQFESRPEDNSRRTCRRAPDAADVADGPAERVGVQAARSVLRERPIQQVQGRLRRPGADVVAVARDADERGAVDLAAVAPPRARPCPTGFASVPPPGPAMPVTATARSTPSARTAPRGHRARDRLAHGAVGSRSATRIHAQQRGLELVGVADRRRPRRRPSCPESPSAAPPPVHPCRIPPSPMRRPSAARALEHERRQIVVALAVGVARPRAPAAGRRPPPSRASASAGRQAPGAEPKIHAVEARADRRG